MSGAVYVLARLPEYGRLRESSGAVVLPCHRAGGLFGYVVAGVFASWYKVAGNDD